MYKIAHIADTHIRNLKFHYEYKKVFEDLYDKLRKESPDCIVHCGDIAHTKTQLSPEYFEMASDFLDNLANIAPTYVILGNHDGNLKNNTRQDAITPIVETLKNKNLYLIKNSGEVQFGDVTFNVLSVFDEDNWMQPSDDSKINIALYHGSISNCQTDRGYVMEFGEHELSIFNNFDYAMLGDIHKRQMLDDKGKVQYAGSTVQQNFGETNDKGFLMWYIEDKENFKVKHFALNNPRPFVTVEMEKNAKLPNIEVPEGCRLRLVATTNIPPIKMKRACDFAKIKWKPHSVSFMIKSNSKYDESSGNLSDALKKENLRDISVQEKYIKKYIKDADVKQEVVDKVLELNRKYNQIVEQNEEVSRNVVWKIKEVKWDNLFNYGEKNSINFDKLNGLVGIFGKNYSGKSSIIDSVLYGIYNTTSKGERKNVHIINQNKESAKVSIELEADNTTYKINRNLTKYTKKLKGKETIEAKVDLDFTKYIGGIAESMNGTTRNQSDLNIRKHFGTFDDFLLTSMSSQIDSLSFLKEGSTKRKEIIAKFLDLEIFDKKFKLAKTDASDIKSIIRRFETKNFHGEIEKNQELLQEIKEEITKQRQQCQKSESSIERLTIELSDIDSVISSIPAEIIDIDSVKSMIEDKETSVYSLLKDNINLNLQIEKNEEFLKEYKITTDSLNIEKLLSLESKCDELKKEKQQHTIKFKEQSQLLDHLQNKMKLLDTHEYDPDCKFCVNNKFVKDAHKAAKEHGNVSNQIELLSIKIKEFDERIDFINPDHIQSKIIEHNNFKEKSEDLIKQNEMNSFKITSNKDKLNLLKNEIESLRSKENEYEQNREAIENLETLGREKKGIEKTLSELRTVLSKCNKRLQEYLIEQGSATQILKNLQKEVDEYKNYEQKWIAYELYMRCMHPNGISYNIIKDKLPLINEEIAKVLANIVDFEVFFENKENKLEIYIKHPMYDPRPLSMGSGAEKTLASMAIRLGLISITNLPKSELFILDEPATALDQEHMEGFIRLLDMIKNQFKTVLLISHLDTLKDVVDMTIDIQKFKGYARVNLK